MSRPGIGDAAYTPRPDGMVAQWAVTVRRWDGVVSTVEVIEPGDVEIGGQVVRWQAAGDGSGVRWARVVTPWGASLAIARAVPLS